MSVTSYPCYWSHLKTFFQLLTCLCTPDKRPQRRCLSFRRRVPVWSRHICIPHIHLDVHIVLCKLVCSIVTAGFTQWHQGFSKKLFEHKLYCNAQWYFITTGQPALVISQRQFTLLARDRGANRKTNVDGVPFCTFTFHILLFLIF